MLLFVAVFTFKGDFVAQVTQTWLNALKFGQRFSNFDFGSEFVRSGLIANSSGAIIGNRTTGPELARIEEALGFL